MHNPSIRRAAGISLVALLAALPAVAQEAPATGPALTLEQALEAARENNPELLTRRNEAVSTRSALRQSRADFLPSASANLGFGYTAPGVQRYQSRVLGEDPAYYSSDWSVGLSYQLSGAKLMQPRIARAQHTAAERRIEGFEANLESQVAQQYLTALQALDQAEQAAREVERTTEHERLAEARLQVGAGTPLDVRRAQVERGTAEANRLQAENTYETELLRLGQLVGALLPEGTRLTTRFALFEPTWDADALAADALVNNPELLAARASVNAARTGVRAARSAYLPSMNASLGIGGNVFSAADIDPLVRDALQSMQLSYPRCLENNQIRAAANLPPEDCGSNPADPAVQASLRQQIAAGNPSFPFGYERQPWRGSLSFSLPLFDGLQRERRVEEARVAASNAELAVRAQEQRLQMEVRSGLLNARTAFRAAELQRQVAANAAEELRMSRERFRLGAANSLEVTDAQTRLADAERAVIDAVYTYHKAVASLEALVGRSLR